MSGEPGNLDNDPWVQGTSSLLPAARAHALGMVGFLWNGCERRLTNLWWLARGLVEEEADGPERALRSSDMQKDIREGLKGRGAPGEVMDEVNYLLCLYSANQENRNALSHYRLRASPEGREGDAPMRLVGFRRRETFEFDDSLEAMRRVADDMIALMQYANGTLMRIYHALEGDSPLPPSPDRPVLPKKLRPHHHRRTTQSRQRPR